MATRDEPSDSDSIYFNDPENMAEVAHLLGQDHYITKGMGGLLSERSDLSSIHCGLMLPLTAWGEKS